MERERSGHAGRQCVFCRVPSGDSLTRELTRQSSVCSLCKEDEKPVIRTATTYIIHGKGDNCISTEELEAIKNHCINPVDSREAEEEKPETSDHKV